MLLEFRISTSHAGILDIHLHAIEAQNKRRHVEARGSPLPNSRRSVACQKFRISFAMLNFKDILFRFRSSRYPFLLGESREMQNAMQKLRISNSILETVISTPHAKAQNILFRTFSREALRSRFIHYLQYISPLNQRGLHSNILKIHVRKYYQCPFFPFTKVSSLLKILI